MKERLETYQITGRVSALREGEFFTALGSLTHQLILNAEADSADVMLGTFTVYVNHLDSQFYTHEIVAKVKGIVYE